MGFFFLLLILGSPVFGGLLYGFYVGARAFAASWGQHGPHMITLRFLALNLCEPLVNSVIVTMLLLRAGLGLPAALFCTAPMAVLLLPALGLGFADPFYRDQCRQILRRGMLRWGTNLVILLGCSGVPVLYVLAILAFLYSLFLLWQTILAGKGQLDVALSAPLPTLPGADRAGRHGLSVLRVGVPQPRARGAPGARKLHGAAPAGRRRNEQRLPGAQPRRQRALRAQDLGLGRPAARRLAAGSRALSAARGHPAWPARPPACRAPAGLVRRRAERFPGAGVRRGADAGAASHARQRSGDRDPGWAAPPGGGAGLRPECRSE